MTLVLECAVTLLAVFGLLSLCGLVYSRLVLPVAGNTLAVIPVSGNGGMLEQNVAGLLWLRKTGLWQGNIIILDRGLDTEGLALAHQLAQRDGVEVHAGST